METLRKLIIYVFFISIGFLAFTLRWWFLFGRCNSFTEELKENLILFILIAITAAVLIYINN